MAVPQDGGDESNVVWDKVLAEELKQLAVVPGYDAASVQHLVKGEPLSLTTVGAVFVVGESSAGEKRTLVYRNPDLGKVDDKNVVFSATITVTSEHNEP